MEPPTSSRTRLRPVSAHTAPQIIRTVHARQIRPDDDEHGADPRGGVTAQPREGVVAGVEGAGHAHDGRAAEEDAERRRTPKAPKTNPRIAARTTWPGRDGAADQPYWPYPAGAP